MADYLYLLVFGLENLSDSITIFLLSDPCTGVIVLYTVGLLVS